MNINPNPRIKYSIITEEKARKYFENGYKNIFYNSIPWRSCIGENLILWFNYNDDTDEWEELDKYFDGSWWQLDDNEFIRRFGSKDVNSESNKVNTGSKVSNYNTIPDPWGENKPIAHKDTSGFKLGDWMLENNPFYFTEKELEGFSASLKPLPKVKVTLPGVYTKMVGCPEPKEEKQQPTNKTKIVINSRFNQTDLDTLTNQINRVLDRKVPSTDILREQIHYKITKMRYTESFTKDEVFDLINGLLLYCIDQGWNNFNDQ